MKNFTILIIFALVATGSKAALVWTQKQDMPTLSRDRATGFTIGDDLYIGTGLSPSGFQADFWKYDTQSDTWTQVADNANACHGVTGFSYNGKGFVAFGVTPFPTYTFFTTLQEYDPLTNQWSFKTSLPSTGRYGASCFIINDKAYFVGGNYGSATGPFSDETWEYNITNDTWSQKTAYPYGPLYYTIAFSSGNFGFVGLGGYKDNMGVYVFNDNLYKYDPVSDSWSAAAAYPGGDISGASAFELNQKFYVGFGNDVSGINTNTFYAYNPVNDTWTIAPPLPATFERTQCVGLSSPSGGYICSGRQINNSLNDLWQLTETVGIAEAPENLFTCFYDPGNKTIVVSSNQESSFDFLLCDRSGKKVIARNENHGEVNIEANQLSSGIYFAQCIQRNKLMTTQKILIY